MVNDNILMQTKKGEPVFIYYDGKHWWHPTAKHERQYSNSGIPIQHAFPANEKHKTNRTTKSRAEAERWAEQIVDYYERMGY